MSAKIIRDPLYNYIGIDRRAYAPLFPAFLRVFHGNYVVII
jgi:hypothetical protein